MNFERAKDLKGQVNFVDCIDDDQLKMLKAQSSKSTFYLVLVSCILELYYYVHVGTCQAR